MSPLGQDLLWDWISVHLSVHLSCLFVDLSGFAVGYIRYIQNVGILDSSSSACLMVKLLPITKICPTYAYARIILWNTVKPLI